MDGLWQALLAGPAAGVWASPCHGFPKFQLQSLVSANVRLPVLAIKPSGPRLHSFAISAFVCARLVHRRLRAGHDLFVGGTSFLQPFCPRPESVCATSALLARDQHALAGVDG